MIEKKDKDKGSYGEVIRHQLNVLRDYAGVLIQAEEELSGWGLKKHFQIRNSECIKEELSCQKN